MALLAVFCSRAVGGTLQEVKQFVGIVVGKGGSVLGQVVVVLIAPPGTKSLVALAQVDESYGIAGVAGRALLFDPDLDAVNPYPGLNDGEIAEASS